ncbi:SAM-dependent methyltransferase [uncultured Aureimonas sp.]|uniref:class I SAM-dependent methyltransferase n=1 Tax=uncultured Aureimonas sp. TaxID=1604662 RepID=UPI0025DD1D66|nr:SAM-dependent methyltransferase [uncultured Aureimonas sp.]
MSDLASRIRAEIEASGPMRLDRFWNLCLFDPTEGYYTSRDPIGASGDFTTAPEISQMFGELLAAWAFAAWDGLGRPPAFTFAEAGPGRGTLMADLLRTLRQFDPAFLKAARIRLIEVSDRLASVQAERLARFDLPVRRVRQIEELDVDGPLLLVANELLDALAIRQFVFRDGAWHERLVDVSGDGFAFNDGPATTRVPASLARLPQPAAGAVFEVSPERDALCAALASRLARQGGAALLIDYGHARTGFGDTLQALRRHEATSALDAPGAADITSHVDFEQVARAMAGAAPTLRFGLAAQGDFLLSLGLPERAGRLGAHADEAGRAAITAAVHRLAGRGQGEMGALFKVFGAASALLPLPPFVQPRVD